ncbi:M23 family metallopeptidase [Murimonas intestini]|uniref:Peptidase M23-like protein n=1 Tax=Murimonas intestini TaxID=1337051 RepID=A0AB73TB16_9FIRM|nr:M23 family metallopeptidase [Murimonas intestini]MCR1838790.1 M23 family metallopeptidase [Murimonas intestini]MCR1864090.1 M23 family metallopeptidase [Murimonas intestini]MCR1881700.1 M23 family metallopeptidase [Murimonas intestini]
MKKFFIRLIMAILMCLCIGSGTQLMMVRGKIYNLKPGAAETAEFRNMEVYPRALAKAEEAAGLYGCGIGETLSVWLVQNRYSLKGDEELTLDNFALWRGYFNYFRREEYGELKKAAEAVWNDLVYFPVAHLEGEKDVSFDNSWMSKRNYGGERRHEGTDVMPPGNKRGYYPIVSMTEGVVEKVGWLEKGGWRLGIRSPHGGYFYYAHLSSYAKDFSPGDSVKAGELLGFMGDSGYGKEEGTTGMFDVHLHLGIYISTEHYEEISVNPYWVLRYLEGQKLKYKYDL